MILKSKVFLSEWRDSLEIGVNQIDSEHKRLFALVKNLDIDHLEKTASELRDYVVHHFSNEQELMKSLNYPILAAHLDLHEDFKKRVDVLLASNKPWTEERVLELRKFLNEWLIGHIGLHDKRFGDWRRTIQRLMTDSDTPETKSGPHRSIYDVTWMKIRTTIVRLIGRPD